MIGSDTRVTGSLLHQSKSELTSNWNLLVELIMQVLIGRFDAT
jgi:hypothetical protein